MFLRRARKFYAKAGKFLISVEKVPVKFDVLCMRTSLLQRRFDVNASLQVERCRRYDSSASSPDLHEPDHVKVIAVLLSFRAQLPSIRRILPNLVDDHVILFLKLLCSDEIMSNSGAIML